MLLLLAAAGIGGAVYWDKYGGGFSSPSQLAAAEPSTATPAAAETSDASPETAAQLLKDLQTVQQQTSDKLEDIQRQLAAEQGERKLLSEQVAALSGRVNGLSASNASATTGMAAQTAKKKPNLPAGAAPRPVGVNRQAGPAPSQ
ncbi:MAG: hypothetical protein WAN93_01110 [Solirubrobacteraceae bacterium]